MSKKIIEYQKAFNSIIKTLSENSDVLAVSVFGSIITGDIWENSDVDLFVVVDKNINGINDIYGEDNGIPMHMRILSKEEFFNFTKGNIGGSTIHRKFISSKLITSKDNEITEKFIEAKHYSDLNRERWNLVYLGSLLKNINACKKCIYNRKSYSSFMILMDVVEDFSKLYLNINGYLVSKVSSTMVMNLNNKFDQLLRNLLQNVCEENVNKVLLYVEEFLNLNLKRACKILLDYMGDKDIYFSSYEIKNSSLFEGFSIEFEEILLELVEKGILYKELRDYKSISGDKMVNEKVYLIKSH
ncbi:nucleotidyltransferase domain-containing protein [Clostridium tarantellae]|uniref:nucleotidyltransferase domain-containing protein n=1 Tax=Clostridium tarantellae TaxID=39493 RepID=UPI00128B3593|nr:nucleotidyltransferase domain-containing protein [Clostridium tarantellae]